MLKAQPRLSVANNRAHHSLPIVYQVSSFAATFMSLLLPAHDSLATNRSLDHTTVVWGNIQSAIFTFHSYFDRICCWTATDPIKLLNQQAIMGDRLSQSHINSNSHVSTTPEFLLDETLKVRTRLPRTSSLDSRHPLLL